MTARTLAARAAASLILAGALIAGTAGCSFMSPKATHMSYDPSDGINVQVGEVKALNLLAIVGDDAETANLLATFVNLGERDRNVSLQYEAGSKKVTLSAYVPAGERVSFGFPEGERQLLLEGLEGVDAGALIPVYLQYGQEEGTLALVPVLNTDAQEYADLGPATAAE